MKLTVIGVPVPQGSKSAHPFRRKDGSLGVAVHEGGKAVRLKDWRQAIAAEARKAMFNYTLEDAKPLEGPISLTATFYLPRPISAPKRRLFPDTKPDLGKLLRAVEDALSKIAYEDDARIVNLNVRKRFAIGSPARVEIEIYPA